MGDERRFADWYVLTTEEVGSGATCVVRRVRSLGDDTVHLVAKVLRPECVGEPDVVSRFLREGDFGRRVHHRSVVHVWDVLADPYYALIMDYVQGPSLREYVRQLGGRLPTSYVCTIGAQIADGLAAMHAAGVLHLDVKPDNVLVEIRPGIVTPRLIDFGAAADLRSVGETVKRTKVAELSPRRAPDPAADVFGLGQTIMEMATGRHPDPLHPELGDRPREVSLPLWSLIEQCLASQPRLRPPAADAATSLRAMAADPRFDSATVCSADFGSIHSGDPSSVRSSPPATPPGTRTRMVTTPGWRAAMAIPARWARLGGLRRIAAAGGVTAVCVLALVWILISVMTDGPESPRPQVLAPVAASSPSPNQTPSSPSLPVGVPDSAGWACGLSRTPPNVGFSYRACIGLGGTQMYGWLQVTGIQDAKNVRLGVELATVPYAVRRAYQTCALDLESDVTAFCGPVHEVVSHPDAPSHRRIVFGGLLGANNQALSQVQSPECPSERSETATLLTAPPSAGSRPGCR